jgi:hypothetical protein
MMKRFLGAAALGLTLIGSVYAQTQNPDFHDAATLAITTGGTSQVVFPYNESRRALLIENPTTATESLFCNFGAAASLTLGTSFSLAAGQSIYFSQPNFVPKASEQCNATTSTHVFVAKEG